MPLINSGITSIKTFFGSNFFFNMYSSSSFYSLDLTIWYTCFVEHGIRLRTPNNTIKGSPFLDWNWGLVLPPKPNQQHWPWFSACKKPTYVVQEPYTRVSCSHLLACLLLLALTHHPETCRIGFQCEAWAHDVKGVGLVCCSEWGGAVLLFAGNTESWSLCNNSWRVLLLLIIMSLSTFIFF